MPFSFQPAGGDAYNALDVSFHMALEDCEVSSIFKLSKP